jgi:hypothetical protein
VVQIPGWDKKAIREEQMADRPSRKCEYCGWFLSGVCHYSGELGCEMDEVRT